MTQLWTCPTCSRYIGISRDDVMVCLAFPDGIPDDILGGEVDHTQPHDGDHGIQYEPRP